MSKPSNVPWAVAKPKPGIWLLTPQITLPLLLTVSRRLVAVCDVLLSSPFVHAPSSSSAPTIAAGKRIRRPRIGDPSSRLREPRERRFGMSTRSDDARDSDAALVASAFPRRLLCAVTMSEQNGSEKLTLTGERTLPGIPEENYWFQRHAVAYEYAATLVRG